ncbi:hypothetical protein CEXT_352471 [Caerostris extrusa]|uniref:Uncharacterized protein n=1 Tax=Caerostris extrusa TaxID=172846 RepID=A0AAV4XF57_CAEEX|nr:hypothetical protein CEXT_352471 [Caerostris extrusa]
MIDLVYFIAKKLTSGDPEENAERAEDGFERHIRPTVATSGYFPFTPFGIPVQSSFPIPLILLTINIYNPCNCVFPSRSHGRAGKQNQTLFIVFRGETPAPRMRNPLRWFDKKRTSTKEKFW